MLYNRSGIQGNSMPLLMGFTQPTKIECDETPTVVYYDQISQVRQIECGIVGTRSLKSHMTYQKSGKCGRTSTFDKKNEIDDQRTTK